MRVGARGVISVTANVAPRAMHEICVSALAGQYDEAASAVERLASLHRELFVEPNPIPVKWAVQRLGLIGPGIRLPLTPLDAGLEAQVLAAMREAGVAVQ
jgi:4-hydroxy-tetrahydrodipicolinate synthase